ncbi:unnamed protein product [Timema podura]|uniref:Uncharacterized protein n=1 Tax=Timema podura TaxID=61482 RepID=A0ABN7NM08_TIMPD|nr:unnamed protein product [Timema podura]
MTTIPLMFAQEDVEFGGKPGITDDFAYNNNVQQASLNIRMGFLRKVYGLLTIQLTISAIVGAICMFQPEVRTFIHTKTGLPTITQLVTHMHCFVHASGREHQALTERGLRHQPCKTRFLALSTFVQAYAIGVVLTFYDQVIVLQALVLTLSVVAGLSAFTFQTKRDFSFLGYGQVDLGVLVFKVLASGTDVCGFKP